MKLCGTTKNKVTVMTKRVALITGGMGGLGETISTKMADAGYSVAVTYSPSNKTSADWVKDMKSKGYEFHAYPCDVADFDSTTACVAAVVKDMGVVDILVNNAGITKDMTFAKMTKADWDAVIHTNLDSAFNMSKQVHAGMIARGWGRIINVSSVNGSKGAFGQTNYAAAKAGMHRWRLSPPAKASPSTRSRRAISAPRWSPPSRKKFSTPRSFRRSHRAASASLRKWRA
jgi:NAD(P)-dependent dehydrogenase (short-subunit alcohol dehydrogenase family)